MSSENKGDDSVNKHVFAVQPPIDRLRIQRGLTVEQLAEESGVPLITVQSACSGRLPYRLIRLDYALNLANALHVHFSELMERKS